MPGSTSLIYMAISGRNVSKVRPEDMNSLSGENCFLGVVIDGTFMSGRMTDQVL